MANKNEFFMRFCLSSFLGWTIISALPLKAEVELPENPEILTTESGDESMKEVEEALEEIQEHEVVWGEYETPAEFPGGQAACMKFIKENLRYPESAAKAGIEGRVVVKLIIGTEGEIKEAKVYRGINPEMDAEALRIIKSMPKWVPGKSYLGKNNGEPVVSYFTLPITFKLDRKEEKAQ